MSVRIDILAAALVIATGACVIEQKKLDTTADPDAGPAGDPELSISPAAHAFDSLVVGQPSAAATFQVQNDGDGPTATLAISFEGAEGFTAASDDCSGTTLAAGASCELQVQVTPTQSGGVSATLTVSDGTVSTSATLAGSALNPSDLTADMTAVDFDRIEVGESSTTITVEFTNGGESPTELLATAIASSDFALSNDGCDNRTLGAGQSCTVDVTFNPRQIGDRADTLTLADADDRGTSVALGGAGLVRITVGKNGTGDGEVVSDPAGIQCGFQCSGLFSTPNVRLTVTPDEFTTFQGWGGGCSGATCEIVLADSPVTVAANFTAPNKVIFISSRIYDSNMGGLAGADAECQNMAQAAGLSGMFKAWLSNDTVAARDRLTHSSGRYVRTDGIVVAQNWADLTDGQLAAEISRTENNGQPPNTTASCGTTRSVWTGTFDSGAGAASSCGNWNTASVSGLNGLFGDANTTDDWSFTCTTTGCATERSIYCIQQ